MAKNNETGHAKNVANFAPFISTCKTFGVKFNPVKVALTTAKMELQLKAAQKMMNDLNGAHSAYTTAVTEREMGFNDLNVLVSSILGALESSDTPRGIIADAKSVIQKIKGTARSKKGSSAPAGSNAGGTTTPAKNHASAKKSFDNRLESLDKLIALLSSNANYKPNEPELTVAGIKDMQASLIATHNIAEVAYINLTEMRTQRDHLLYLDADNLFDVSKAVKSYVRSVFKASSNESKQLTRLKFTRIVN